MIDKKELRLNEMRKELHELWYLVQSLHDFKALHMAEDTEEAINSWYSLELGRLEILVNDYIKYYEREEND